MSCLRGGNFLRGFGFFLVVGYFRRGRFWPRGLAERQLWAIWGGYLVVCFVYGISTHFKHVVEHSSVSVLDRYQGLACMTAFAFIVMAPTIWGYSIVIGVAYLLLAFVMAFDLMWAPLEFGVLWAVVLVGLGLRLRRLGRELQERRSASLPVGPPRELQ